MVPQNPGASVDNISRILAVRMSEELGQQIVADNRAGAGGNIGADLCAKSPPDGYTICMMTVAQAISPAIYRKLGFDPIRDFAPVSVLGVSHMVVAVHPTIAQSLPELVKRIKVI